MKKNSSLYPVSLFVFVMMMMFFCVPNAKAEVLLSAIGKNYSILGFDVGDKFDVLKKNGCREDDRKYFTHRCDVDGFDVFLYFGRDKDVCGVNVNVARKCILKIQISMLGDFSEFNKIFNSLEDTYGIPSISKAYHLLESSRESLRIDPTAVKTYHHWRSVNRYIDDAFEDSKSARIISINYRSDSKDGGIVYVVAQAEKYWEFGWGYNNSQNKFLGVNKRIENGIFDGLVAFVMAYIFIKVKEAFYEAFRNRMDFYIIIKYIFGSVVFSFLAAFALGEHLSDFDGDNEGRFFYIFTFVMAALIWALVDRRRASD